jgi:hypothetical protein
MFNKLTTTLGHYTMQRRRDAFIIASLFAVIPFFNWLSLCVASLVTLRKGMKEGLLIFAAPCGYQLIKLISIMPLHMALLSVVVSNGGIIIATLLLRAYANWNLVALGILAYCLVLVTLALALFPDYATLQLSQLKLLVAQLIDANVIQGDIDVDRVIAIMAKYMLGIQVCAFMLSAVVSLCFARFIQARLYNPGEFGKEFKHIESHWILSLLFLITLAGIQMDMQLAASALPLLCCYFSLIGISLFCYYSELMNNQKRWWWLLVFMALFLLPFSIIPLIPIGILDSVFKFRKNQSLNLKLSDRH